ncbi:hypothetical protein F4802DRAFT_610057 [Xylaria palmicola]|nr:hypothetical protein F4802DRAFT_610057 [Xylaria palmicola]
MLTPQHSSAQQQSSSYLAVPPAQASPAGRFSERESTYGRPASSVYSQPSPEAAVFAAHQLRNDIARNDALEISPPSSPDISSRREGPYHEDVSPIDEVPDTSLPTQGRHEAPKKAESRSNIPMMRRERRKNSDAVLNSLRESKSRDRTTPSRPYGHDVRWDPRTGEPTTGTKGRPSQVNPQEYAHGLANRTVSSSSSAQSKPNPQNLASLRDRLRLARPSSTSPQPEPAPRPEWRGASGRAPIVSPVRDNTHVTPLRIPPKSTRRPSQGIPVLSPVESNGSEVASLSTDQPQSPDITAHSPSMYPTPPLSEDAVRANRPLRITSNDKALRRKPARASSGQYSDASTSINLSQHNASPQVSGGPSEGAQPTSRFSITTYATSNHTSTPRGSIDYEAPPMPTPPQLSTPTPAPKPTPEVSVLSRGRPAISGYEDTPKSSPMEPVKINLESPFYTTSSGTVATKSRPAEPRALTRLIPEGNHSTLSVASVLSLDKSLPPAPPEASAKDRVTELNAQLEALGNRRININTAIRKMTEMMPTDNVLASDAVVRKREAEKRKVETLKTELADVERQSYELGLRLHRAYKRLDRDAEYEPTTLWVRRVTH